MSDYRMTKKLLPLTRGLLCSMAIRTDHSFNLDKIENAIFTTFIGHTPETRISLLEKMYEYYLNFELGYIPCWSQEEHLYEEVTGNGFYSKEREYSYALSWPSELIVDWFQFNPYG